ncbi:MAG: hypothetical protein HOC70_14410, partial [Gammaproteobacteria bacterium]|nr:hypothetical protein [Gammaproteobacteria bacterium]
PHRHHLLFEHINSAPGRTAGQQLVIHTGWGSRVNRPLAMALEAAWEQKFGELPEVFVANESIVVQLPHALAAEEILSMVPAHRLESLLRLRLEGSGFFSARFRENAGRSLLLSKGRFNERKPLWMSRLQSQKLIDAVLKYEDFPILLETWRTCLQDEFDMDNLKLVLSEVEAGEIVVTEIETATPSPFAQSVAWSQINTYMYMLDTPKSNRQSQLGEDLLKEVVFSPGLRPRLQQALVLEFEQQRQRLAESWLPQDDEDLTDWITERSAISIDEWQALITRLDFEPAPATCRPIRNGSLIVSIDDEKRFSALLADTDNPGNREALETFLANWLQYYGPISMEGIESKLGIDPGELMSCLLSLTENHTLISDQLLEDDDQLYYCDAANYEYLLRLQRASRRSSIEAKPIEALIPFLFAWQTRQTATDPLDRLYECVDRLRGLPLPAALWETEILPARLNNYEPGQLDLLFQEGELMWLGLGEKTATFCLQDDLDLILPASETSSDLITQDHVRYDFNGLLERSDLSSAELTVRIWQEVWHSQLTNDAVLALRRGIETEFKPPDDMQTIAKSNRRRAFNNWRSRSPFAGNWLRVPQTDGDLEPIEQQELEKERVRLALNRNGIIFRELCTRESDAMEWRSLFRALRLMELSGEVVSGRFFEQIPGPQFMTPESLRHFQENRDDLVFFINATDPISPSGLGLGIHGNDLPRRIPSNYLVYHGTRLVLTVGKRGRELVFHVDPGCEDLGQYLQILNHLSYRAFQPVKQLSIEKINDHHAADSPYLPVLETHFNIYRDYKSIILQREL